MTKYFIVYIFLTILFLNYSCRKGDDLIPEDTDVIVDSGTGTGTVTWTKDMDIVVKGYVFVNEDQVLTIEPGTTIKFETGQGASASTLVIARGGKIIANGTYNEPIVFTSVLDDGTLPADTSGLWGGIIVLGAAPINTDTGEDYIEGIPITEARGQFGGDNEEDNSGCLQYISIRYAGTFLHESNEINGLTLGGVGNQTTVENIEVINSADDGIEIFGGTVNLKNIISVWAHDDAIDYEMGYNGNIQYVLAIQSPTIGDNLIEGSGSTSSISLPTLSKPVIANATLVGNGNTTGKAIYLQYSAGGYIVNSIITDISNGVYNEYIDGLIDGYSQWKRESLVIENNLFYNTENNVTDSILILYSDGEVIPDEAREQWKNYFTSGNNELQDPMFAEGSSDFKYIPGIATNTNLYDVTSISSWFDDAQFKGAFLNTDWTDWAFYKQVVE